MQDSLHVHQFKETVVPPTCKDSGYTLYTCECGYEHKTNFKPAGAHDFRITAATPATCQAPGEATSVCTVCGETQTRVLPPIGHDFGEEVVQAFPTCQRPGTRIRKCRRCDAVVQSSIDPVAHRCAPGTAQFEGDRMVSFFCENCGQTIHCDTVKQSLDTAPVSCKPTSVMWLLSAIFAFLSVIFAVLTEADGVTFISPLSVYGTRIAFFAWSGVFFLTAKKIKGADTCLRWMGVAPLTFTVLDIISMAGTIQFYTGIEASISPAILFPDSLIVMMQLALMIIFFVGAKKKTWLFVLVLVWTSLLSTLYALAMLAYLQSAYYIGVANQLYSVTVHTSEILYWVGITMLLKPGKKAPQQEVLYWQ